MKVKSGSFLEVFNYKDLLNQLVSRDIKLKYRRSFLGYVWSILNPLLIMIVMVIVFSKMFNRSIPHFPVYLFAGRILYEFVIGACGKALGSITDNSSLVPVHIPSGLYICLRIGLFSCTAPCILQRYKIYMECGHHSVDVLFSDILSYRYAARLVEVICELLQPTVCIYQAV